MGKLSKFSLPKIEFKISEKAAIENLMVLLQYYDIDVEAIEEKKLKDVTETTFNKLVRYIRQEVIKVVKEEKGGIKVIQNLQKVGELPLVYNGIGAENKISMDGFGENDTHQRMYSVAGSMSGIGEAGIRKLRGQDMSAMECIAFVFLQV